MGGLPGELSEELATMDIQSVNYQASYFINEADASQEILFEDHSEKMCFVHFIQIDIT